MKTLFLTLSELPFKTMVTGEKIIEFRKPSNWILARLQGKTYDFVQFTWGYGKDLPRFISEYKGWRVNHSSKFTTEYSTGLKVDVEPGDIMIFLGKPQVTFNL